MLSRYRKKRDMRILPRSERLANARSAMTLVELLVVVMILLILMGISAAAIRPLVQGRDIRESARLLNAFLARAQSRAIERGRPVAVVFERLENNPAIVLEVFQSDVPPPYTGDLSNHKVIPGSSLDTVDFNPPLMGTVRRRLRVGDLIKFNFRGPKYRITALLPLTNSVLNVNAVQSVQISISQPNMPLPQFGADGLPFQIYHLGIGSQGAGSGNGSPQPFDPLHFTVVPPLQFPDGVVIDVGNSGPGVTQQFNSPDPIPISLVFSPEGRIAYLGCAFVDEEYNVIRPLQSVHFLLGRADQLGPENLADLNNMWVSVGHQSGRVITTENAPNDGSLSAARSYALGGQAAGGR